MLNAIIIDDEIFCQDALRQILEQYFEEVKVIGVANSVQEGLRLIKNNKIHIVFLDVEMPNESGFQLFEYLEDINFEVVFTTAFDKYALKAIQFSALAYLLKPIALDELQQAINKAKDRVASQVESKREQIHLLKENLSQLFQRIALPTLEGFIFISLEEIVRCEADAAYTNFYLKTGKKHLVSKPIKEFEELLTEFHFQRVHRSHIINLNCVREFLRGKHPKIITSDGKEIALSPLRKEAFMNKFLNL